ncbi:SAM-dependent methyltransferase, partial [Dietzia sp. NPDC055343]
MSRPGGPASGEPAQVHLVGVGPGPVDLLTVRASRLIAMSGTCLHAHGLVPREAMSLMPPTARVVD